MRVVGVSVLSACVFVLCWALGVFFLGVLWLLSWEIIVVALRFLPRLLGLWLPVVSWVCRLFFRVVASAVLLLTGCAKRSHDAILGSDTVIRSKFGKNLNAEKSKQHGIIETSRSMFL